MASRKIAIQRFNGWRTTDDLATALVNGYIGETLVVARRIPQAIRGILIQRKFKSWRMYYYGKPDARLRKAFGYDEIP